MEIFWLRQLGFRTCPYILDKLDCFVRHQWFTLSVFFHDGKLLLETVEIFSLLKKILDNWIADCLIWHAYHYLFSFVMKFCCTRSLKFCACHNTLDQLDHFVRHTWFVCLLSFVMENSCSNQLEFLAYITILGQ